jgi:hypothetical protein
MVRLRGSFAADLPLRPWSRLSGVLERASPSLESESGRFRRLTTWKMRFVVAKVASLSVEHGGGAMAPRSVDSPSAMGGLPVQAFGGCAAGFAGAASCKTKTMLGSGRTSLLFLCFPGFFCKKLGRM